MYYHAFEKDLITHLPKEDYENLTKEQKQLIASSVMDSLLFAGGLSVPGVLKMCIGLLVDGVGSDVSPGGPSEWKDLKTFQLKEDNAALFVWETMRRFPPVGALSYMDIDPNTGKPNHQV